MIYRKVIFVTTFILSFAAQAQKFNFADTLDRLRLERKLTLAIKSPCKNSDITYMCEGGFKIPEKLLSKWKKDPQQPNDYYVYEDKINFVTDKERYELIGEVLKLSCASQTYAMFETRDIRHCPDEALKQQIMFTIKEPTHPIKGSGQVTMTLSCNAAGGSEWLKLVYPQGRWTAVHNLPHYYEHLAKDMEEYTMLEKFISSTIKKMPAGCRYMDCEPHKPAFDVCK